MSEISQVIDAAIAPLHAALRQRGFAKGGRTYRRRQGDVVQVLNVQASSWNSSDEGSFTVNLGVFFPAVASVLGDVPAPTAPSEGACHVRQRLGFVMPEAKDHWWTVTSGDSNEAVARELVAAVEAFAVPWLEAHSSLETALESAGIPPYWRAWIDATAMCVLLNRLDEASAWLKLAVDAFRRFGNAEDATKWSAWGREHGVVVA